MIDGSYENIIELCNWRIAKLQFRPKFFQLETWFHRCVEMCARSTYLPAAAMLQHTRAGNDKYEVKIQKALHLKDRPFDNKGGSLVM